MRTLLVFATVVSGCAAPQGENLQPFVAVAGAYALVHPAKPDAPKVCQNCNGTGKIGDGTVFVECPVCKGTGK
jgi:hypothetical protein